MFAFFELIDRFIVIIEFVDTHCAASSPKPIQLECWTTTNFLSSRVTTRVRQEEINHGCSGDLQFFQHNMSRIWDCVFFSFTIFEVIVTVQRVWRRSQFSIFCIAAEPIKKRGLYLSDSGAHCNLIDSFYCVNILAAHLRLQLYLIDHFMTRSICHGTKNQLRLLLSAPALWR